MSDSLAPEDLAREVLGDALHNAAHPGHPWSGCPYPDLWYDKVTHFMGDITAGGFTVRPVGLPTTPAGTRLVLMTDELMDELARSVEGRTITWEWGAPDEHGWYAPMFTERLDAQDES